MLPTASLWQEIHVPVIYIFLEPYHSSDFNIVGAACRDSGPTAQCLTSHTWWKLHDCVTLASCKPVNPAPCRQGQHLLPEWVAPGLTWTVAGTSGECHVGSHSPEWAEHPESFLSGDFPVVSETNLYFDIFDPGVLLVSESTSHNFSYCPGREKVLDFYFISTFAVQGIESGAFWLSYEPRLIFIFYFERESKLLSCPVWPQTCLQLPVSATQNFGIASVCHSFDFLLVVLISFNNYTLYGGTFKLDYFVAKMWIFQIFLLCILLL